jgi:starch synthase
MRILFATAEFSPVAMVGGLGSASAGLVRELRHQGHDVEVVLPDYRRLALHGEEATALDGPTWAGPVTVRRGTHPDTGPLTLVHTMHIERPHPYLDARGVGWSDNDLRFQSFTAAVAQLAALHAPDVVHLNDWHTAATLSWLPASTATVFSIHNLAYQGSCDISWAERLGARRAAFLRDGATNPMAGALRLAGRVIVVSPNYRAEILEPHHAFGLHDLISAREPDLVGIRNGVETDVWNPGTDPFLDVPFDADHLDGKTVARRIVCDELGLADAARGPRTPLAVVVSRLAHQKGIDMLVGMLDLLERMPARLAVLGGGDHDLAATLHAATERDPRHVAFVEGFDEGLGHRMIAGADLLLMPSRFEPCGLTQMQAMRYGTIPVVTGVGGLCDTVIDADTHPRTGTGFVAARPEPIAVLDAWHRANRAVANAARRRAIQRRGMCADWSWDHPARDHVEVYTAACEQVVSTRQP